MRDPLEREVAAPVQTQLNGEFMNAPRPLVPQTTPIEVITIDSEEEDREATPIEMITISDSDEEAI